MEPVILCALLLLVFWKSLSYLLGRLPHHSLQRIGRRYGPLVKLKLGSVPSHRDRGFSRGSTSSTTPETWLSQKIRMEELTEFTLRMVMNKAYFGSEEDEAVTREFIQMQHQGTILLGEFCIGDYIPFLKWFDSSISRMKKLHRIQDEFVKRRLLLLLLLFSAKDLLGAGTDTSITTIQWAMAELLNNPSALNAVIKETFRLHPPVPLLIPHQPTQDSTTAGMAIAKGTRLFVNVYAIGRDPSLWKSPDDFIPERFLESSIDVHGKNFELLPFGSGRRGCPGMALGLLTVKLALANLLQRFQWRLPRGVEAHTMAESFGLVTMMEISLRALAATRNVT